MHCRLDIQTWYIEGLEMKEVKNIVDITDRRLSTRTKPNFKVKDNPLTVGGYLMVQIIQTSLRTEDRIRSCWTQW